MTDTIFKIIQTLTNGFKIYKESKKNLHENFLKPAMTDFEKVHENYIESYKNYSRLLGESTDPFDKNHPVFQMIKEDALFSMNIREKVYSFYDYTNDEIFSDFIISIMNYFKYSTESANFNNQLDYEMEMCRNSIRTDTYHGLIFIMESNSISNKKSRAIKQTKMAVKNLQDRYRKVIDNYNALKIELLN